jgi:3-phosphoshikimate 1-carboxyvinyltransferase
MTVESDWSSASYFFSIVALSKNSTISLKLQRNQFAGDSALVEIYKQMGVDAFSRKQNDFS